MFLLITSLLIKHVYVHPKFQEEKYSKTWYGIFGIFETLMEAKDLCFGNVNCCHRTSPQLLHNAPSFPTGLEAPLADGKIYKRRNSTF